MATDCTLLADRPRTGSREGCVSLLQRNGRARAHLRNGSSPKGRAFTVSSTEGVDAEHHPPPRNFAGLATFSSCLDPKGPNR
jgi:hypothetical protein